MKLPATLEENTDLFGVRVAVLYAWWHLSLLGCPRRFHQVKLMQRILPDIRKSLNITAEERDEFADDPSMPAEIWEPRGFSTDTPIGQILFGTFGGDAA